MKTLFSNIIKVHRVIAKKVSIYFSSFLELDQVNIEVSAPRSRSFSNLIFLLEQILG